MKTIITGFFDQKDHQFESILQEMERLQVQHLFLRSYQGKPLLEITESEIKDILNLTKVAKIKVDAIHTMIKPYDIHAKQKHDDAIDEFKFMIKLSDKLKVQNLMLELPVFQSVIEEYEIIAQRLEDYVDLAAKNNKKIMLVPATKHKANTYAYIIKKMKTNLLSVVFDPVYFMMNNESTTTSYRLLKGNISAIMAVDADHQGEPQLLGYGKTDILNIFKKLLRDGYKGYIMMDHHFHETIFKPEIKKKGFFSKIFSNEEKKKEKALMILSKRIFPNEETKNVTLDDILENQIKVVMMIFK